jgi:tRNA(adenine34) deaminase
VHEPHAGTGPDRADDDDGGAVNERDGDPLTDDAAMVAALEEAAAAPSHGDVPIGAVVVHRGRIVARRHNEREVSGDPTAHVEVLALRDAALALGDRRLGEATLVVTLEPCPMCAGAAWAAQIARVVYGAADLKAGAVGSLYNIAVDRRLNHQAEVVSGVRGDEAAQLLTGFFDELR